MTIQDRIIDKLLAKGWKPNEDSDPRPNMKERFPIGERGYQAGNGWYYLISPDESYSVALNPEELFLHKGKTHFDKIVFNMRYEQIEIKRNELLCDNIFSLKL